MLIIVLSESAISINDDGCSIDSVNNNNSGSSSGGGGGGGGGGDGSSSRSLSWPNIALLIFFY